MLNTSNTLANLATQFPAASRIFYGHGLDYCCGGQRSLQDACANRDLDADEILKSIQEANEETAALDWNSASMAEITAHLISQYHEPMRRELPRLIEMATRVEQKHHDKDGVPRGLTAHLNRVWAELELHLQKEEEILFPLLDAGQGQMASQPILVMRHEHDDVANDLKKIRSLTFDLKAPVHACATWQALYLGLQDLEAETMQHVHIENNILFPRASNQHKETTS